MDVLPGRCFTVYDDYGKAVSQILEFRTAHKGER